MPEASGAAMPEASEAAMSAPMKGAMSDDQKRRIIAEAIAQARPAIQADGGDIEFVALRGQRVEVRLSGKCLSCALAGQTLGAIRRKLLNLLDTPVMVVPVIS
jgi:Fe-S cluster biogenesis protein NfuA